MKVSERTSQCTVIAALVLLATAGVCHGQGGGGGPSPVLTAFELLDRAGPLGGPGPGLRVAKVDEALIGTDGGYDANANSAWHLSCSDAQQVPTLNITAFDTEYTYDFVHIFYADTRTDNSNAIYDTHFGELMQLLHDSN